MNWWDTDDEIELVSSCARMLVEIHGWDPFKAIEQAGRFWSKVDRNGPVPGDRSELGPCWLWTATLNHLGRPQVYWMGRLWMANRVALWMATGIAPAKMDGCHECDVPPCVRPDHLWWGTRQENVADMWAKGRAMQQIDPEGHRRSLEAARQMQQAVRGEDHGRAVLTWQQVREIRAEYVPYKVTQKALAERFGVSERTIREIIAGRHWKEVMPT